jgi:Na+/proline symporter
MGIIDSRLRGVSFTRKTAILAGIALLALVLQRLIFPFGTVQTIWFDTLLLEAFGALLFFFAVFDYLYWMKELRKGRTSGIIAGAVFFSIGIHVFNLYSSVEIFRLMRDSTTYLWTFSLSFYAALAFGTIIGPGIGLCRKADTWIDSVVFEEFRKMKELQEDQESTLIQEA